MSAPKGNKNAAKPSNLKRKYRVTVAFTHAEMQWINAMRRAGEVKHTVAGFIREKTLE